MDRCSIRLDCGCLVSGDGKVTLLPLCNGNKNCKVNDYLEQYMHNLGSVIGKNLINRKRRKGSGQRIR